MKAEQIRDGLLEWMTEHRKECPLPEAECFEPLGILAFLCHCAGLRADRTMELREPLAEYEARCQGCTHLPN